MQDHRRDLSVELRSDIHRITQTQLAAVIPPDALDEVYLGCQAIADLPWVRLGVHPGSNQATKVKMALSHATSRIQAGHRRFAAQILLGLSSGEDNRGARERIAEVLRALQPGPGLGADLVDQEISGIEDELAEHLLALDERYAMARRSEDVQPRIEGKEVRAVDWETYAMLTQRLAERIRPSLVSTDPGQPTDRWDLLETVGIIGIARGGLPVSVHLSHLLRCRLLGMVGLWRYPDAEQRVHPVIDSLFAPPADQRAPHTILVVDDVVAGGETIAGARDALRERYDDVEVLAASLFRDTESAPVGRTDYYAQDYDSRRTWWWMPWEGEPPQTRQSWTASRVP